MRCVKFDPIVLDIKNLRTQSAHCAVSGVPLTAPQEAGTRNVRPLSSMHLCVTFRRVPGIKPPLAMLSNRVLRLFRNLQGVPAPPVDKAYNNTLYDAIGYFFTSIVLSYVTFIRTLCNTLFGMKRCSKCHTAILSSELVMRARELVFHVHCFSCAVCSQPLTKGDHFGMREGAVLCRLHFEMPEPPLPSPGAMYPGGGIPPHSYPAPYPSPDFHHAPMPPQAGVEGPPMGKVPFFNGAPATPRQKGRPRKRKPKDLEGMTASLDLSSDYLDMSFGRSPGTPGMHGSSQRTKRMRTSFKHHQLRTMKSYFAINHNPDAKDLKQLSQKTGLPKRVLQLFKLSVI
ncbi:hypothetical protein WA026_018981 [Henosepilachna vigintioctopunctata]|uniref:Apterous n=1 Tax=Henosepilachna vigintioctopunctata TaxID=420089 RepID=A0AAW1UQ77_9CUCU